MLKYFRLEKKLPGLEIVNTRFKLTHISHSQYPSHIIGKLKQVAKRAKNAPGFSF